MRTRIVIGLVVFLVVCECTAQTQESNEPDIQKRLDLIKEGNIDQARSELTTLLERYPQNPGVLYLQGVLTVDGGEAVRTFQNLADNFPKSEWADDALYKIYQYYYALGLYKTADQKLEKLRREYPQSQYLRSFQQQISMQPELTQEPPQPKTQAPPVAVQPDGKPQTVPGGEISAQPPSIPKAPAGPGAYTVQSGVFSSLENAERYQSGLSRAEITSEIRKRMIGGKEMYTVCIGSFTAYEDAQRYVEVLKEKNISGIVISR
jgi:tetratricopeptide (TPR) repeat protein